MTQFRVPVVGPFTNRVSAVNALDSSSGYVGVGIVGMKIIGPSFPDELKAAGLLGLPSKPIKKGVLTKADAEIGK